MARTVVDNQALAALLRGPNGPLATHLLKIAEEIRTEAKGQVGVKTGNLRARIVKRFRGIVGDRLVVTIEADTPYALFHHEGTRPHVIRARRAPFLVFFWPKVGRVVYFKSVNHPGTKPNKFLTDAAARVVARHR